MRAFREFRALTAGGAENRNLSSSTKNREPYPDPGGLGGGNGMAVEV